MLRRSILLPSLVMALLVTTGCNRTASVDLSPLADMARSGAMEITKRVNQSHAFLASDVLPHPEVEAAFTGIAPPEGATVPWQTTPYIAAAVFGADGEVKQVLPRASDAFADMLKEAAGAEPPVGDLVIVPNTTAFTLGMHVERPAGGRLAALLDVDRVILDGVLVPLARGAHGVAFLANHEGRILLSIHPSLAAVPLERLGLRLPEPGKAVTGQAEIAGEPHYVGLARGGAPNGWIVGVATPTTSAVEPAKE